MPDGPTPRSSTLPYGFARRNGVVLRRGGERPVCSCRAGASVQAMIEVQRLAGPEPERSRRSTRPPSTRRWPSTYRDTASDASEAAAADGDLAALADSAALVDDLLDQSDDAPVVRLINALLLEAIKENASDIHIETQERRLVVRFRVDGILREVLSPGARWRRCWSAASR